MVFMDENIMRKYTGNKYFYIIDANKMLGYGKNMDVFALFLIAKLHRSIWICRCKNLNENTPVGDQYIEYVYKKSIKRTLVLEKQRLTLIDFQAIYMKNEALCDIKRDVIYFFFVIVMVLLLL